MITSINIICNMSLDKFGRSIHKEAQGASHLLSPYRHGFTFTSDGNIDVENLKLCNVHNPHDKKDAVNKAYVDDHISVLKKEFHTVIQMPADIERKLVADKKKISESFNDLKSLILKKINKLESDQATITNRIVALEKHTR